MAGEMHVKVLTMWPSHYGMRVLLGLQEKGITYDCVEENLLNKSALLLEKNPVYKKVPVLIHNGRPVAESLVALQYIDETWSSLPSFLPSDPYDRAMARFWADFIDQKIYGAGGRLFRTTGEEQETAKRELVESLIILEGALKGKDYFGGDMFGFVDIVLTPMIPWFHTYETVGGFKIPLEDKCPCIAKWMNRCKERPSVKKVLPEADKLLEFVSQVRKLLFVKDG